MSTAARARRSASIRDPEPISIYSGGELSVFVVFTSMDWTLKALEKACEIARPLGASIAVAAMQVVPFPLQLDEPPVSMDFILRRLEEKAGEFPEKIQITVYLCRDLMEALRCVIAPTCPVVIGARKRLWPTPNERFARKLRRAGYDVVLANQE